MTADAELNRLQGTCALIIGDVMLDRFIYGKIERISPEAPTPILRCQREAAMPGGAANVARNIAALGGRAFLLGVVGNDKEGDELDAILSEQPGISPDFIRSENRPTTVKVRYVAERQQILRVDREETHAAAAEAEALLAAFRRHLPQCAVVVLSDYAKGVLSDAIVTGVIAEARQAGKPVIVDPKSTDLKRYNGASLLTPNRAEAIAATKLAGEDDDWAAQAAGLILDAAPQLEAVLITRGPAGMTLAARRQTPHHIGADARAVFDVSGAGDTVVAMLALALGAGMALAAAATLANVAAGIVVGKPGTAVTTIVEIANFLQQHGTGESAAKIATREQAAATAAEWRRNGLRVGFTNGCFDILHPGHVRLLEQARASCDRLVVGLNDDASVRRLKGESRPIQNEASRAAVMAALAAVDQVCLFGEDTPLALIKAVRPDVLLKGADYRVDQVVGADFVQSYGGKVKLIELVPDQSTTSIAARAGKNI